MTTTDEYVAKIASLEAEVERLQVQLAGCSVAAHGYAQDLKPPTWGWSVALEDVNRLYRSRQASNAEVANLRTERTNHRRELRRLNAKLRLQALELAALRRPASLTVATTLAPGEFVNVLPGGLFR